MASGSFSASILSGHYTLRVDWTSTPDTATNTSSVVVTSYLVNDWSLQVGSRTVTNVVNGVTQTYTAATITTTGTHSLGSVTQSVTHNSDGSKAITIQVAYPIKATIRDTYYSEIVATQSVTLDNIPRQSTISSVSPSNVTVGSSGGAVTVNIARNSSSFTHTVVWSFGSNSYTQTGQTTSATYTIPASWLSAIPNIASGTARVTVSTYNGNTLIGSTYTDFTITAGVYPSIGSVTTAARGTAYTQGVSGYIAGYSTALVSASSVAGVNGSSISTYEFLQDGVVKATVSSSASSNSWTSGTLSGNTTFSVRVTDSRGLKTTKAATAVSVSQYAVPAITANAFRSNSAGTADASGTYIRITASATATPSANSITALTYATKATTSSSWSAEANIGSGVTANNGGTGFANTTSWDVRVKATDKLGQTSYKYFTIPTQAYTMDFKVGGKGVAFGKVAETDELVDSDWGFRTSKAGSSTSGGFVVENSSGALAFTAKRIDINREIELHVGSGGINRGLYINDGNMNGWLIHYNDSNIFFGKPVSPTNLPVASATEAGIVSTGVQTFAGTKTFTTSPSVSVTGSDAAISLLISSNSASVGYHAYKNNYGGRAYIVETSGKSDGTGKTGYSERYFLPQPAVDRTSTVDYSILTSKNAVTVAQGGTGATTAAAARANLSLNTALLKSGVSTSEVLITDYANYYSTFVVVGIPGSTAKVTCTIPKVAITSSYTSWQINTEGSYTLFQVRLDGNNLYAKVTGNTTSGKTIDFYGIRGA